jgi:hypothetical protein
MASLPDVRFGVIDDARRRQRRRWIGWIAVGLVALVALVLAVDRPAPHQPSAPVRPVHFVPASRLLSREPYMGVSCSTPNSTSCDRFGLAVWLKRPALTVQAEIRGRTFALNDRQWSGRPHGNRRKMFAGFLQPARLQSDYHVAPIRWEGQNAPHPLLRLRVDYGRGAPVETRTRVWLSPGWG